MGLFDHFPYTNIHELNLAWILEMLKEIDKTMSEFVAINALKYADPIQWNITSQYEKNTIVIDPQTGTAYISVRAVPLGVSLTNTDYWTVVFDLGSFVVRAAKNFSDHYEDETTTTATFNTAAGNWLVWGDTLYVANVNITAGDSYVVGGNITHFTIEDAIGHLSDLNTTDKSSVIAAINEVNSTGGGSIALIGDLDDLLTTAKDTIVNAINEVLGDVGDLATLDTTDKSSAVAAINEVVGDVGDLSTLTTTDQSSAVAAINEVVGDVGDLATLDTTDKSSAVAAINEVVGDVGDLATLDTTDKSSAVAAINEVVGDVGDLSTLTTTDQSSAVAAINEVNDKVDSLDLSVFQKFVSDPYFENIGVLHTYRATDEIIGQDICKIGNTLLLCNRGTVTGLNADSHIYSIDLTTGSYNSVVLPIGHGNGITYNPDENMLYICPLDPTQVGGMYVIHRVNYPAMTMATDVYTNEYYASLAYDRSTGKFVGMRRNAPTKFDIIEPVGMIVESTIDIPVQGIGQTLDAYDGLIYILESAPNKISISDYEGNVLWCYIAPDHFSHYPLGEFNGISVDPTTKEIFLGNNLNYGNGFLVSSYNFFRINLFNNNVYQHELGTTYYAEEYLGIEIAPNNTIFQYGTVSNPVSLLEYAIAMAHCIDNPAINFDADYDGNIPTRIVSMTGELTFTNASHTVTIAGLTLLSCNKIVMRGITIDGKCIETNACVLCNDSSLVMQNCTIDKASAGVGTEMVLNRGDLIAPSSPFSGYTISGSVNLVTLA